MSRSVYDTRFFIEHFYSKDSEAQKRTNEEIRKTKERFVSTITLHELFKLTLEKEGRETARLRREIIEDYFKVVAVDAEIAVSGAELRHKYKIPMGDSLIAATSSIVKAVCITDDPHIKETREIKTKWI